MAKKLIPGGRTVGLLVDEKPKDKKPEDKKPEGKK